MRCHFCDNNVTIRPHVNSTYHPRPPHRILLGDVTQPRDPHLCHRGQVPGRPVRRGPDTRLGPYPPRGDPHGSGRFRDEYLTTSVYFDTPQFDVFHRHGSFGRSKYRIRRYGEADVVFLERKLREPTVLAKRRTATALADLERLDTDPAAESWPGRWFQARLAARRLRPVCQVAYRRTARLLRDSEDIVRLTLDDALSAQPLRSLRFRPGPACPPSRGSRFSS
jgi:hypothetical protein